MTNKSYFSNRNNAISQSFLNNCKSEENKQNFLTRDTKKLVSKIALIYRYYSRIVNIWRVLFSNDSVRNDIPLDLFHPKMSNFSTLALISVDYKAVHSFSQPIFNLFSHLKNTLYNLVIELCSALKKIKSFYVYFLNSRTVL